MEPPKTYRCSKLLAVIFFVVMLMPIVIFISVGWKSLVERPWDMLPPLGFLFLMVSVLVVPRIVQVFRSYIRIEHDRFILRTFGQPKDILFSEIKGYRIAEKQPMRLVFKDESKKNATIQKTFNDFQEIKSFIAEKFVDLDELEAKEEEKKILENTDLGLTEEERKASLKIVKVIVRVLTIGAIALSVWMLYPSSNTAAVTICALYPLIVVYYMAYAKGLVGFFVRPKSPKPSVFFALLIPVIVLMVRSTAMYDFVSYEELFVYSALIAVLTGLAIATRAENIRKQTNELFFGIMLSGVYAFGVLSTINCDYDSSISKVYYTTVSRKTVSYGKSTDYYLWIPASGPFNEEKKISVSRRKYETIEVKDRINLHVNAGTLGMPWYYLSKK
jgi:ABC-type multidrug transport system fused ATPase/permease subunit